jgi:ABC-2 type transport system ATP-binding protein
LKDFPGVIAMAQIGAHLRVLAKDGNDMRARVAQKLHEAGVEARVDDTTPNLEDVFVAATHRAPHDAAATEAHA